MWWCILSVIGLIILALFAGFLFAILPRPPRVKDRSILKLKRIGDGPDYYSYGKGRLQRNCQGLWELYVEGGPFDRGVMVGRLTHELVYRQEEIFVHEVRRIVPSRIYMFFLKVIVAWMNRRLGHYIGDEYNAEIYGVSLSASREFNHIGPRYIRLLNYHAAHDVGHTLQSMNLVGCTSFAAWGERSESGELIVGRNFDFYIGDEFCREKIVAFYNPEKGFRFIMINWGGMIGTVSGMNEHGLVVTVNGAKSKLPHSSAMPISMLIREMLQYARNLEDAIALAQSRTIFVSESILVASASEGKAIAIEKSPEKTAIYQSEHQYIICTNHYQGEAFSNDKLNQEQIRNSSSMYRYKRMEQLINRFPKIGPNQASEILRDRYGIDDKDIGMGNEKASNQLVAHHSVIFMPGDLKVWVCAGPYTLGKYVCYDLKKAFELFSCTTEPSAVHEEKLTIAEDPFMHTSVFERYGRYKELKNAFRDKKVKHEEADGLTQEIIDCNPEFYMAYSIAGDYFYKYREYPKSAYYYNLALGKEVYCVEEEELIRKRLEKSRNKMGKS